MNTYEIENKSNKQFNFILLSCVLIAIFLFIGHYYNSNIIRVLSLVIITIQIMLLPLQHKMNYILFFISWSAVLKISPDQFSFNTFLIPIALLSYIFVQKKKLKIMKDTFILFILICSYIIIRQLLNGYLTTQLFVTISNLGFIMLVFNNLFKFFDFKQAILSFSLGVLATWPAAIILRALSHMSYYFKGEAIAFDGRLSGFDADPNFNSIKILMAISTLMVLQINNKESKGRFIITSMILLLTVYGFWSVSKMYLLLWCFVMVGYLISFRKNIIKVTSLILLTILVFIFLSELSFVKEIINNYTDRFTLFDLTTGRIGLQHGYIDFLINSASALLFGIGIIQSQFVVAASHNTYIQTIYLIGITGTVLLLIFIREIFNSLYNDMSKVKKKFINYMPVTIFLMAMFALDFFFSDDLPVYLALIVISIYYPSWYFQNKPKTE